MNTLFYVNKLQNNFVLPHVFIKYFKSIKIGLVNSNGIMEFLLYETHTKGREQAI